MIDITGVDLVGFVKAAYDLSRPQGMGFLHARPGGLSDEEARGLIEENDPRCPVSLDYVHGRACKMHVHKRGDRLFINDSWYDHTDSQLRELLRRCNVSADVKPQEHGCACNCSKCNVERGAQALA